MSTEDFQDIVNRQKKKNETSSAVGKAAKVGAAIAAAGLVLEKAVDPVVGFGHKVSGGVKELGAAVVMEQAGIDKEGNKLFRVPRGVDMTKLTAQMQAEKAKSQEDADRQIGELKKRNDKAEEEIRKMSEREAERDKQDRDKVMGDLRSQVLELRTKVEELGKEKSELLKEKDDATKAKEDGVKSELFRKVLELDKKVRALQVEKKSLEEKLGVPQTIDREQVEKEKREASEYIKKLLEQLENLKKELSRSSV